MGWSPKQFSILVQVAESIKLEKTELEMELGQLTGQVARLQARVRSLIEEQVRTLW
jgi:regulator of replication initiation timing